MRTLLDYPARLQNGGGIGPFAQLGDAQFNGSFGVRCALRAPRTSARIDQAARLARGATRHERHRYTELHRLKGHDRRV